MVEMSNEMLDSLGVQINAIEFDSVFTLTVFDKSVARVTFPAGIYAPNVDHSESHDVDIDSDEWEALTGFTQQYSYRGAVNHSSEFIGRGIAGELVRLAEDEPQTFVVVVVSAGVLDEHEEDEPVGWAILRKV